jgi:catechol 2,3-dioxygenase-like lactoylglutathione lyase family enzyme
MVAFYTNVLGLKKLREIESVAPPGGDHTGIPGARRKLVFVGFGDGGHQIELVHYIDPPSPKGHLDKHQFGATHVCFNVRDLEKVHRDLSDRGVRFVTPPKFRDTPSGRIGICYAQDPEGNWLEFIQAP